MVPAQIFLYGCVAFIAGVGLASLVEISRFLFLLAATAAIFLFLAGLLVKKNLVAIFGIIFIFFILGWWRFEVVWRFGQENEMTKIIESGEEIDFVGLIKADPVFNLNNQQIVFKPEGINGKILVIASRYPEFRYGDKIKFIAKLETPGNFNGFDYQNYLAKSGIYSTARNPKIELVSRDNGNPVYDGLLWIKHKLQDSVNKSLPSPHSVLLSAILFGDQSGLEGCSLKEKEADPNCAKLKEKLNISGLRHLSAVSGTHVTIMAQIIAALFIALGFWRQTALRMTLVFIWCFILMIGLPASAVRAGIMGSLMILAQIIGRPADILRIITIAAALMVLQNPLILRFDIGFQLSFMAVAGMAYFSMPIQIWFNRLIRFDFIKSALATALAAQIFTLPILIYNFGYVSTYSLVANVLVEPIVSFITIYGFILAIAGAISAWLGWLLMTPIWMAISYLLSVVELFSSLPYSKFEYRLDFIWFLIAYFALMFAAWKIEKTDRLKFLG